MKKINKEVLTKEFWLCDTEEDLLDEIEEFLNDSESGHQRIMRNAEYRFDEETGYEAMLYYNIY